MSMLSSNLLRRVAPISGRRLTGPLVQTRAFATNSSNYNDLERLEKKENILAVRSRRGGIVLSRCFVIPLLTLFLLSFSDPME